ncbi:hypothetical protein ColKHC_04139 [Colletotrichum higginsianum]|nr:hypothetical protein ColKHC_04139 [Colletotrichum higginsianum]
MGEFVKEWNRSSDRSLGVGVSLAASLAAATSCEAFGVEENCLVSTLFALDLRETVEWRLRVAWADASRGAVLEDPLAINCLRSVEEHCPQTLDAALRNAGSILGKFDESPVVCDLRYYHEQHCSGELRELAPYGCRPEILEDIG